MKISSIPANILSHQLVFLVIVIIVHLVIASALNAGKPSPRRGGVPGSTSRASVESLAMEDFQHLTDKLTHKILQDIEERKKKDPNWGKPGHVPEEEDMSEEQMKEMSECEFHCPKGQVPEENPSFERPTFQKCRPYDSSWDRIPGASDCCTKHQICYHTCARDRVQCDMEFRMCIENVCVDLQEKGVIKAEKVIQACQHAMGMLGIMIMEPGCTMYPKAQGLACLCVENTTKDEPEGDVGPGVSNFFGKDIAKEIDDEDDLEKENDTENDKTEDIIDMIENDAGNESVGDVEKSMANDDDDIQDFGMNDDGKKQDDHDEL